ncbi:hypothetical protein JB92DRAFT_2916501 [Gautieria morchelliformis]|nr:hypothetical protein JB92DRAFT_2916501 [Gautieria morchelliformis]
MAQSTSQGKAGKTVRKGKIRACAECRRLKLRCDRGVPCQSCIRRGCTALCPNKCFTDEATPSSLKATSLRNREQIQSLKQRVTDLEDALASNYPTHPLLAQRNLPSLTGSPSPAASAAVGSDAVEETLEIFGSLSIGEDGSPVFHGATSLSEHFVRKSVLGKTDHQSLLSTAEQSLLPASLRLLSALFPFTPETISSNSDINEMLPYLPPATEALEIVDRYWHHLGLGNAPIRRHHFMKNIFDHIYPQNAVIVQLVPSDAHRLGVMFITLAMGILTDITKPILSTEAEMYHQLARASLSFDPICENTTIHGLQCLVSITQYLRASPTRASAEYLWALNGVLLKLGSSIGIFRDSRRWLTDVDAIEQREVICWELLFMEVWQSFTSGRPCSVDFSLADSRRPPEFAAASAGLPGFFDGLADWRYRLAPIINNVMLVVQRSGPVKYTEILNLELQLRECPMPEGLSVPLMSSPLTGLPSDATTQHLQRFTALITRESACCLLHRRFLVLAMQKEGNEPPKTPFWYSAFQAGYSAVWISKAQVAMYRRYPELISRVPLFWSISFSAAVVLGAIVARYWNRDYAKGTLRPFEKLCALFEEAADTSLQPLNALEILRRLRQRVQAKFPTSSDAAKNFNDLPLLGAQPPIACPPLDQTDSRAALLVNPDHHTFPHTPDVSLSLVTPDSPDSSDSSDSPMAEDTGMASLGQNPNYVSENIDAVWAVPDLRLFHDTNGGEAPFTWPDGQVLQPDIPEGLGRAPVESFVPEAGQWNQFLDRLGVWE